MTEQGLERATAAIGDLSSSVRSLQTEVVRSEALRTEKIRWIQRVLYVVVPAVVLMLVMATTNFFLLSRINSAASAANSTNNLLLGCFLPDTKCSQENLKSIKAQQDQIRQTQFVIAICQRQNPVDVDPEGNGLVACVQSYYPGFKLPPPAPASPSPSGSTRP